MAGMMVKIFVVVFLGQIGVIFIIVFFLIKVFKKQLVESAIQKVETLYPTQINSNLSELRIVVYQSLSEENQKRIKDALIKKINKDVKLNIVQDRAIKGGIIIELTEKPIDNSLSSRLKEAGVIK